MKTFKILFGLSIVTAALGMGCTQDPYANQPDEVKNAGPMDPKPREKKGDALSSAYLRIQTPNDTVEFSEGAETKVTIKGAVLADVNGHEPVLGQDYQLTIDNIADFPGASWDATSGEFKWTPRPGFVTEAYTRNIHIEVTLVTLGTPVLQTSKSIIGVITRGSQDPTIESIDDLTNPGVKEGETRDFKVWVRDPHATDKSADTKPRLSIVSDGAGSASAAGLIYCIGTQGCSNPEKDPNDPQRYSFKLKVDLTGQEITKDTKTLSFSVMAISRFGETSAPKKQNVVVKTKLNDPDVSWSAADPIEVVAGRQNLVNFTVFDPGSDSTITVNYDTACNLVLGPTATCTCSNLSRVGSGTQLCKIIWDVPANPFQTNYAVRFTTFNRSKDQSQYTTKAFERNLKVIQPAQPPVSPVSAVVNGGHQ